MTLVTGSGLFLSGTVELADQIFTEFDTAIGIHQGVILLGIVTFLRGIADLVEALRMALERLGGRGKAQHIPVAVSR